MGDQRSRRGTGRMSLVCGATILGLAALSGAGGCRKANVFVSPPPPEVCVMKPSREVVTRYDEFTGRTEPAEVVEVRARVTGVLEAIHFEDSTIVEAGDPLFAIEKGPYAAAVLGAEAALAEARANLGIAEVTVERVKMAYERNAATEIEVKKGEADRDAAQAAVQVAEARLAAAQIDLDFTDIVAPLDGRVSRHLVSIGNLVGPGGDTLLTTIVDNDPMYAYFTVSERQILAYLDQRREGTAPEERSRTALLTMTDGTAYDQPGRLDFADNQVDPRTGTVQVRAIFPNPDEFLVGGLFVRVRIPLPEEEVVLVPERAVQRDMASAFVLVVNAQSEVERVNVELGDRLGKQRIILPPDPEIGRTGLDGDEAVIVEGLQRARPGISVTVVDSADVDEAGPGDGAAEGAVPEGGDPDEPTTGESG